MHNKASRSLASVNVCTLGARRRSILLRTTLLAATATMFSCSSDSPGSEQDGDAGSVQPEPVPESGTFVPEPCPTSEPLAAGIELNGGTGVFSADGIGGNGGRVELLSSGAIIHEAVASATADPDLPVPPGDGIGLMDSELSGNVTRAETIRLTGLLRAAGPEPLRSITSTEGDLVIDGVLRVENQLQNNSEEIQELTLSAPAGTVFINGLVDTSSTGAQASDLGGAIRIVAQTIVVDGGTLRSTGRGPCSGGGGGEGGAITLRTSAGSVHFISGLIDSSGGAGDLQGHNGGHVTIDSAGAVFLDGTILMSGGRSEGTLGLGGAAGHLRINSADEVRLGGTVHGNGGSVTAGPLPSDTTQTGGSAGNISIGVQSRPPAIRVVGPMRLFGGDGNGVGGTGGIIDLQASAGDIRLAAMMDVSGGASQQQAGNAGTVTAETGPEAGGIFVDGRMAGHGGAELSGAQADARAGAGASVTLRAISVLGPIAIGADGEVETDGGESESGRAGPGGIMDFRTRDGNISIGGKLASRGGSSYAPGGRGGQGGAAHVWTDTNFNGIGGDLTVEATGLIDVSGGEGSMPGSARNNGTYGIAHFPINQHQICVLLNSETVIGPPDDGRLVNHGQVIATGGIGGGFGGDVMFHGRQPDGTENPVSGMMMLDGDGGDGDFVAE